MCKLQIIFAKDYCPDKNKVPEECLKCWTYSHSISVQSDFLMKDSRIIIPCKLREVLSRIHGGHHGTPKCRTKARESV